MFGASGLASAASCHASDPFGPSLAQMQHALACRGARVDTYTINLDALAPASTGPAAAAPDAGGPSCQWSLYRVVEICSNASGRHIVCSKWFAGSYYPYNCGPAQAWRLQNAQSLWDQVIRLVPGHASKQCIEGVIPSGGTALLIKITKAGKVTPLGIVISLGFGCVGGVIKYYWGS